MSNYLILRIGVVITIVLACSNKVNKQGYEEDNKIKILTVRIDAPTGEVIELNTFVYDSCMIQEASTIKNAIKKQELLFIMNGTQISKSDNLIGAIFVNTNCADSLKVVESVIYEIGVLEGSKGNLFCIKGSGLCNACPELFAFYTMSGKCVWLNYANQYKIFNSFGDFNETCNQNGIDSAVWFKEKYKKVDIGL